MRETLRCCRVCGSGSRVIYSRQKGVLFTHVSRTGGTTMSDCLLTLLPDAKSLVGQHAPLAAARPVLGDLFTQTFKFACVRNPWERFVSWFALIGQAGQVQGMRSDARFVDPASDHWKGFDAFLENWSAKEMQIDGVPRRQFSQWAQLADRDGVLLTDDFGRFETLAADAVRLFAKAGIECPSLPKVNVSYHHHYSAYYSAFGRELIEQIFPEDVVQLGYRFEEPTVEFVPAR